jgi:hypothetical protein
MNLVKYHGKQLEVHEDKIYGFKGAVLYYSSFREIIFLENNNMVMKDPTFLFDTPAYKETGTLFWKDMWKTRSDNPIYKILEIKCTDEYQQESGQMVINKSHPGVMKALVLALFMEVNNEFYFTFIDGDKDCFRFAYRALGVSYHMVQPFLAIMGTYESGKFCGSSKVQFAPFWSKKDFGEYPADYIEVKSKEYTDSQLEAISGLDSKRYEQIEGPKLDILFIHKDLFNKQFDIVNIR